MPTAPMVIDRQRKVRVARKPLENFLRRIRKELKLSNADISVALVSDAEIARLNRLYRNKDGSTDVLSFPSGAVTSRIVRLKRSAGSAHSPRVTRYSPLFLGDIAIAPATARRYARKHGRTLSSELRVLLLHGVLHLLGYDHETDRGQMNRIERKLRRRLGLA